MTMNLIADVIVWAAIPIFLLACGGLVFLYWLTHHDQAPWESAHVRAERAYFSAKAPAAAEGAAQQPAS
jgi:hypothetical protein